MTDELQKAGAPAVIPRENLQRMVAGFGRIVSEHGIDTGEYVTLGGARQWITIRGQDKSLPILLYLHGGPGGALSHWGFMFQRPWEEYFTVVNWDQRGFGKSNIDGHALDGTLHKNQVIRDAIELIQLLLARFGHRKLILVGQSWGSLLGLEVTKRVPDLLYVLATIGQVTAWERSFELTRNLLMRLAQNTGDKAMGEKLTALGQLPASPDEAARFAWISAVQNEMFKHGHAYHNCSGGDELNFRVETLIGNRLLRGVLPFLIELRRMVLRDRRAERDDGAEAAELAATEWRGVAGDRVALCGERSDAARVLRA